MDKTKTIRVSVEEELAQEHIENSEISTSYYTTISEKQIREIIRDELKNIELEKMYHD